ncbi:bifunctional diaminohydroxyphosphoribosylaminopyrimidine deaminase/5-amino-6-(5-phosphoribosylamino)uracil reductase [Leptospira langatensis]|uniref:Bifunctional diaminohydroxyphosphoribosylaminopyrimidine deaminase/5-amino-6-(5-phosphoribosylamino)uracil reductase n=1 Tax=Leptospira langatensis TaxID=2484983 RepID=A0A5F1ZQX0_9LEPT|nr:bifunctional diaminohydroxyphosphoribosylaminopyrimidine deaminase/5-amino-6-(5-phosphoribosylamino)uracil reductase [Leptospira langatensis]TGK05286.1 bifunctional diaminohydroxyphosphoribosylaminopyrimidine deaminase/5-amino-6-(5-phosphoribosylamino)uracil reductase [Leptospira langatensis]TGL38422.1 bifunctional diaminohydroxyphosphoribosylaminopyrimidine deaminase/5-amino-6-(5-phosphoribosylamino)uracil reductase [Leptospira langatensis]
MSFPLPDAIREELLRLSFVSTGYSSPNPPVACVLEDANTGEILSSASTRIYGGNHAEREAYRILREKFPTGKLADHNAYVTLEPCSHYGKTPPCIDLFVEERPKRLEYGWKDPNPLVSGNSGLSKLDSLGIQVIQNPELAEIASHFLFGFKTRIEKKRPAFLLKSSLSKEGYFSSGTGLREKISSYETDFFLSILRAKVDAILVGPKTVQADIPGLDFRISESSLSDLENVRPELFGSERSGFLFGNRKSHPAELGSEKVDSTRIGSEKAKFTSSDNLRRSLFGFSGLLQEILQYSTDKELFRIHLENQKDYQPLRVFFLPEEDQVPSSFLKKQEEINARIGKRLCAFFLNSDRKYSQDFLLKLEGLSESKVVSVSFSDFGGKVLGILGDWGINLALIEGGNFLYKTFSALVSEEDAILQTRSETVSIPKGILPEWKGEFSMDWKADLGDHWEVWRSCSQD